MARQVIGAVHYCARAKSIAAVLHRVQQARQRAPDVHCRIGGSEKDNRNLGPGVVVAKDQLDGHAAVWLRLAEKQIDVIGGHTLAPM